MKLISNALTLFIIIALAVMALYGKPKQQALSDLSEDDLFCMVQNLYFEAWDQSLLGQAAVAHVTLNRVRSPAYPDSVCDVVWQDGQFSWTQDKYGHDIPYAGAELSRPYPTCMSAMSGHATRRNDEASDAR